MSDDPLATLFRAPLDRFVAERNRIAAELRKGGDREGAERVKGLARPTASAWAVNQLAHRYPEELAELIAAGDEVRAVQMTGGSAAELRAATEARRAAGGVLLEHARTLLAAAGNAASDATLRRVQATLGALAAWGSARTGPPPGRLTEDLDPPGFESLAALAALPAPPRRSPPKAPVPAPRAPRSGRPAPPPPDPARIAAAEAVLAGRKRAAVRAETALRQARDEALAARRELEEAGRRRERARAMLAEAEAALATASERVRAGDEAAAEAAAAETVAAAELAEADAVLRRLREPDR